MKAYVEFEISEGAYELSCPDALCNAQGVVSLVEVSQLVSPSLVEKHHRYRLNRGLFRFSLIPDLFLKRALFQQKWNSTKIDSGARIGTVKQFAL